MTMKDGVNTANPDADTRADFPRMLYRFPATNRAPMQLEGSSYDTMIVNDADEAAAALADSWCTTWPEAKKNGAPAAPAVTASPPPTREELEAKATELGIAFKATTSDKKLGDQIAAALEP